MSRKNLGFQTDVDKPSIVCLGFIGSDILEAQQIVLLAQGEKLLGLLVIQA